MTTTKDDRFEAIRVRLEERYEYHTGQLRDLMAGDEDPASASVNAALRARSRQALSDIAGALRQMAEGKYGQCLDCQNDIPMERLEARPDTVLCAQCQATHDRRMSRRSQAA
jgi:RNA polymerase-binding transcription factor